MQFSPACCHFVLLTVLSGEHRGPSMSVCPSRIFPMNRQLAWPGVIFGTYCCATVPTEVSVGINCCNSGSRCYCWCSLLHQWERRSYLVHSNNLGLHYYSSDLGYRCRVCYFLKEEWPKSSVPLSYGYQRSHLLTSPPVMWREAHLWNVIVLHRAHLSSVLL
jgi:hypothetical protein